MIWIKLYKRQSPGGDVKKPVSDPFKSIEETQQVLRDCIESSRRLTRRSQELLDRHCGNSADPAHNTLGQ